MGRRVCRVLAVEKLNRFATAELSLADTGGLFGKYVSIPFAIIEFAGYSVE